MLTTYPSQVNIQIRALDVFLFWTEQMLEIRYSNQNEVDISGEADDLQRVRQTIIDLAEGDHCTVALFADIGIRPDPYDSVIQKMLLMKGEGPTKISLLNEKTIKVEGLPENLKRLASFFDLESGVTTGQHSHYEYYEGNEWIAADSIPLVISVK
jgi:hypothetical protein